jgi:hypothetical protein
MAVVSPHELVRLWASEQIAPEHAIGQLVQQLAHMQETLDAHRRTLTQVQSELATLRTQTPPPSGRSSTKRA